MSFFSKKKGFTLIELIVVMAIIAILASLAVGSYLSYRKATLLDLAADNLVSQVFEMKEKADHGKTGNETDDQGSYCYGIQFLPEGENYLANGFKQPFNSKKIWNSDLNDWSYGGCEDSRTELVVENEREFRIISIKNKTGNEVSDGFFIRFLPPDGKAESPNNIDSFVVEAVYGDREESKYKRFIEFDLNLSNANVKRPE